MPAGTWAGSPSASRPAGPRAVVISSAVGGLVEVVRHEETGILLGELSAGGIAGAVSRLMRESSLREKLINDAEVFSRRFDGREQLAQITDIYEKLCS